MTYSRPEAPSDLGAKKDTPKVQKKRDAKGATKAEELLVQLEQSHSKDKQTAAKLLAMQPWTPAELVPKPTSKEIAQQCEQAIERHTSYTAAWKGANEAPENPSLDWIATSYGLLLEPEEER